MTESSFAGSDPALSVGEEQWLAEYPFVVWTRPFFPSEMAEWLDWLADNEADVCFTETGPITVSRLRSVSEAWRNYFPSKTTYRYPILFRDAKLATLFKTFWG